jgi:quercetin dioxygenase-like cupin family protein
MKKTSFYSMAILLVPWYACTTDPAQPIAKQTAAEAHTAGMILPPAQDTTLPSGRRNIYLAGLRTQPGFFVERSTFPAGYKGMPHVHNQDLYVTIISGSAHIILGSNTFDTTVKVAPYGPGSFVVIKADQPHYEWFTEECTMQIEGMGPNETYYISNGDK